MLGPACAGGVPVEGPSEARAALTHTKNIYEVEGLTGYVRLVPGVDNKAVPEFRRDEPANRKVASNLVITVDNNQIVSMTEYRRSASAHRRANVAA